jgi:hypothetical protein
MMVTPPEFTWSYKFGSDNMIQNIYHMQVRPFLAPDIASFLSRAMQLN